MRLYVAFLIAVLAIGCSKVDVKKYDGVQPRLELFSYFHGETKGWGIIQDRKGLVTRSFVVDISGKRTDPNTLVLEESFRWRDGEESRRTWTIEKSGANAFKGSAGDVVGHAMGASYGNALNWKYYLNIKVNDAPLKIHLDDWMFLLPDNVLLNKTKMRKFGIHLGDITIIFRKVTS